MAKRKGPDRSRGLKFALAISPAHAGIGTGTAREQSRFLGSTRT